MLQNPALTPLAIGYLLLAILERAESEFEPCRLSII
jgi:hypothetical protein